MSLNFDPNAPAEKPKTQPEWATYVPYAFNKRPKFKTHTKLQHALAAADINDRIIIFKWVDGKWVEQFTIDRDRRRPSADDICFYCKMRIGDSDSYYSYGYSVWRRERGKVVEPLELVDACAPCERASKGR